MKLINIFIILGITFGCGTKITSSDTEANGSQTAKKTALTKKVDAGIKACEESWTAKTLDAKNQEQLILNLLQSLPKNNQSIVGYEAKLSTLSICLNKVAYEAGTLNSKGYFELSKTVSVLKSRAIQLRLRTRQEGSSAETFNKFKKFNSCSNRVSANDTGTNAGRLSVDQNDLIEEVTDQNEKCVAGYKG